MYLQNLDFYNKALLSDNSLIKLTVNVTDNEVTVNPSVYVTYNNIIKNILKCLVWLKVLPVWRRESCIVNSRTIENKWKNAAGNYENTFYGELIDNESVREKIELIRNNSHSLMVEVNKYLKKYGKCICICLC